MANMKSGRTTGSGVGWRHQRLPALVSQPTDAMRPAEQVRRASCFLYS
jgi:hypothetical protein